MLRRNHKLAGKVNMTTRILKNTRLALGLIIVHSLYVTLAQIRMRWGVVQTMIASVLCIGALWRAAMAMEGDSARWMDRALGVVVALFGLFVLGIAKQWLAERRKTHASREGRRMRMIRMMRKEGPAGEMRQEPETTTDTETNSLADSDVIPEEVRA